MRSLEITAADGVALPATLCEPDDPQAVVVVSPATATPRGFYHSFCRYLAQCGAAAVTYDYRGTFEAPESLRHSHARMRDWGERDFAGVAAWAARQYPRLPVYAVGHSVGGHVLLMTPENARIERAVLVASQSGYWQFYRGFEKYRVYAFVRAIMPVLTRACGYFPGRRVVFGTDLAPGVLYEWSRWCTSPGYFVDDPTMTPVLAHARTLHADVTMIGVTDDPWATPDAIGALVPAFSAARIERFEIDPSSFGLAAIGHMGFFRSANGPALWPLVAERLGLTSTASMRRT
jgi:predicted alpha/beta hydrolase